MAPRCLYFKMIIDLYLAAISRYASRQLRFIFIYDGPHTELFLMPGHYMIARCRRDRLHYFADGDIRHYAYAANAESRMVYALAPSSFRAIIFFTIYTRFSWCLFLLWLRDFYRICFEIRLAVAASLIGRAEIIYFFLWRAALGQEARRFHYWFLRLITGRSYDRRAHTQRHKYDCFFTSHIFSLL